MSDDRIQSDGTVRPFRKEAPVSEIADKIMGKPDPLALPQTNDPMAFQRAVRRREKLQRQTVVRTGPVPHFEKKAKK